MDFRSADGSSDPLIEDELALGKPIRSNALPNVAKENAVIPLFWRA